MLWLFETETLARMYDDAQRVAAQPVNGLKCREQATQVMQEIAQELANRGALKGAKE